MNGIPLEILNSDNPAVYTPLESPKEPEPKSSFVSSVIFWIKDFFIVMFFALLFSFVIKTFVGQTFFIPSGSMESTLQVEDRIFVSSLDANLFGLERGDIVVFDDQKGWLPVDEKASNPGAVRQAFAATGLLPDSTKRAVVKRIIGMPGDHVVCCDKDARLTVNGVAVNETYINDIEPAIPLQFDVIVPEGKLWVMGDNRNYSGDSRVHQDVDGGFVDIADVEGKVMAIAWPLNRIGKVDSHPEVFSSVPLSESK